MIGRFSTLLLGVLLASSSAFAGQAPFEASAPDFPISHQDRFYTSDQFSNTISVIDPAEEGKLLGVIRLGDPAPGNLSPLYKGQLLVHGMGFSPDRRTLTAISIGSNSVSFIDLATNKVKHITYVGRSPHEAFFTPDGREVWVSVRGENYIAVLDATTYKETLRIEVPNGPGMTIFSPDGKLGYVCSSFSPETLVISTADHKIVGSVKQESPFCPDIAATPDGKQVWLTLKDIGRTMVFNAVAPFNVLKVLDTGPITNHVNIVRNALGQFAYVTVGGGNHVKAFRTDDFTQVADIVVGALPHGLWPSGDGSRLYVGLENADAAAVIDTLTNKLLGSIPVGQGPQGVAYVPGAVPEGAGTDNLQPLGVAANTIQIPMGKMGEPAATQVTLFDQGLVQVVQAAVTGLEPKTPYLLALANDATGIGALQPLAAFTTNPAGAAIVNAVGPIRQIVQSIASDARRYLVIASGTPAAPGPVVQVQQ